jgi:hypothetical protein
VLLLVYYLGHSYSFGKLLNQYFKTHIMATFISSLILYGFAAAVLGLIGKLIYDIQQTKKSIKVQQNEITADEVNNFQKLAGIKPIDTNDEIREILVKNNLNVKEQIVGELLKAAQNSEFPAPDQSIPMISAKLTTIELGSKEETDPLASVPLSRVSKKAKQKMAEIAKQDISEQLEQNAENYAALIKSEKPAKSIFPEEVEYTDEYFKPDYSKSKKKNPKQDIKGIVDDSKPFKKTRKKATKNKKENE